VVVCACPQLLIPAELSHDAIDAIGEIGQLQFKDLNADKSVFQRTYANQVCSELPVGQHSCSFASPGQVLATTPLACPQVKRTDEMARKLRFFHDQVHCACR
jgi:V-type H+-transporting ATPase subunit a